MIPKKPRPTESDSTKKEETTQEAHEEVTPEVSEEVTPGGVRGSNSKNS